jgi:hypothetical protein
MVSSPSTILGSSGFNGSPSSHTDPFPMLLICRRNPLNCLILTRFDILINNLFLPRSLLQIRPQFLLARQVTQTLEVQLLLWIIVTYMSRLVTTINL